MKTRITFLLLLVVISSGCTSLTGQDTNRNENPQIGDEETPSFSELVSKAKESEYTVEYEYNLGPLMYDGEPKLLSSDGIRRVMRFGTMPSGEDIVYNAYYSRDAEIACTKKR